MKHFRNRFLVTGDDIPNIFSDDEVSVQQRQDHVQWWTVGEKRCGVTTKKLCTCPSTVVAHMPTDQRRYAMLPSAPAVGEYKVRVMTLLLTIARGHGNSR